MDLLTEGCRQAFELIFARDQAVMQAALTSLELSLFAVLFAGSTGIMIGAFLAHARFPGAQILVLAARVGMSFPTVLVGLVGYALLSRQGPLGQWGLLYTKSGVVACEVVLVLPIVISWSHGAFTALDPRIRETAWTLGANRWRILKTELSETRLTLGLAILSAFSRCFTELGVATMIGGNIKHNTRTLATATALETSRGNLARAMAMGFILIFIALTLTITATVFSQSQKSKRQQ